MIPNLGHFKKLEGLIKYKHYSYLFKLIYTKIKNVILNKIFKFKICQKSFELISQC